jgi:hypothetical protein
MNAPDEAGAAERRLLASRCASVVFLTGCARRGVPYFDAPFDAIDPRCWKELGAWIAQVANPLVTACAWVGSTLGSGSVEDLQKVCSATHHAAHGVWPQPQTGPFRARSALSPDDPAIAHWIARGIAPGARDAGALLLRAHAVVAPELSLASVPSFTAEDAEDGAIVCEALSDLLAAEWRLWSSGNENAAARVNVARSLVGAAAMSEWSADLQIPDAALSAAEAGMRFLGAAR